MRTASSPTVSIVICSIDHAMFRRVCERYRTLYTGRSVEIVGIHDARSLAEGYERGIAQTKGEVLILSHDDIDVLTPDFAARVAHHLAGNDLIGVAGTTRLVEGRWAAAGDPYVYALISSPLPEGGYGTMLLGGGPLVVPGIQALDGVLLAMQRRVFAAVGFDAAVFDHFHLYDLDFSFRAYRAGFKLAVCRDIVLIHESTGRYDAVWREYKRRFDLKHREHLLADWKAKEGARASFSSSTREDILRKCAPVELARIAAQIERANSVL
ncbi:MAG TPA: glycosyltransferase [Casimicrobiaceae bacterium]|nr:glycosyltransferase [Casimicrobiaceae bacterium]